MIRVAIFFHTLSMGGTERQAMLLLKGIDRKRFEPIVYAAATGPLEADIKKLGIRVRKLDMTNAGIKNSILAVLKVRSWLAEDRINVLHCLLSLPNIIGRFACLGTSTKCINSIRWAQHVPYERIDFLTRFIPLHWVANSEYGAEFSRLPKSRTAVIHNGIDEKLLAISLSAWKPRPKTAIMVAQFRVEKRHDVLLETAKVLPDWKFTLVGDGPLLAASKKLAKEKGLKNVDFLGHVKNPYKLMLRHEVSILLSSSEGSPNVALESMALGVPFIGSDIPAHWKLLGGGRGRLVELDAANLSRALQEMRNTPIKRLASGRVKARKHVQEHHSVQKFLSETMRFWVQLTAR